MISNVLNPFPGPETSPIAFDSKMNGILGYLCIRSSDTIVYGHRIHF